MPTKIKICAMAAVATALLAGCAEKPSMNKVIDDAFANARVQYGEFCRKLDETPGKLPRSLSKEGMLELECPKDTASWIVGFFPGTLWLIYEYGKDGRVRAEAEKFTAYVEPQKDNTTNHDVGFMVNCSYGNQLRIAGDDSVKPVMLQAARSLASRYNPAVGCTQSWRTGLRGWKFPVIIDNMMNLELLMWAFRESGDSLFYNIAVDHANTTMANHFRPDYSSYHVVSYNPVSGEVEARQTQQGYSDDSSWMRGQAWGLYGYTMMYRETGIPAYLEQARKIAGYILDHPAMPGDKVLYWDVSDPAVPDTYRDVSAAAIMCSALVELSGYCQGEEAERYRSVAEEQIRALASDRYTAPVGTNGNYLLMHSVGNLPKGREVDAPLCYADYYYLEALMRYKKAFLE